MSAQERVDAIRARLAAATPGPWYVERSPANCDLHGHVTIWLDGVNDDGSSRNTEVRPPLTT